MSHVFDPTGCTLTFSTGRYEKIKPIFTITMRKTSCRQDDTTDDYKSDSTTMNYTG